MLRLYMFLIKLYLKEMVSMDSVTILNVVSIAGFMPAVT